MGACKSTWPNPPAPQWGETECRVLQLLPALAICHPRWQKWVIHHHSCHLLSVSKPSVTFAKMVDWVINGIRNWSYHFRSKSHFEQVKGKKKNILKPNGPYHQNYLMQLSTTPSLTCSRSILNAMKRYYIWILFQNGISFPLKIIAWGQTGSKAMTDIENGLETLWLRLWGKMDC